MLAGGSGFLKGGSGVNIERIEIHNSDEKGVMEAIPALKEAIIGAVSENISSGGIIRQTIRTYG